MGTEKQPGSNCERTQVTFQGDWWWLPSRMGDLMVLSLSRPYAVTEGRTGARNPRGRRGRKETGLTRTRAMCGETGVKGDTACEN